MVLINNCLALSLGMPNIRSTPRLHFRVYLEKYRPHRYRSCAVRTSRKPASDWCATGLPIAFQSTWSKRQHGIRHSGVLYCILTSAFRTFCALRAFKHRYSGNGVRLETLHYVINGRMRHMLPTVMAAMINNVAVHRTRHNSRQLISATGEGGKNNWKFSKINHSKVAGKGSGKNETPAMTDAFEGWWTNSTSFNYD